MRIAEIFESIHGEVNGHHQGMMCTFIRVSGCTLNCFYCDTPLSQNPKYGENLEDLQIMEKVHRFENIHVCLTGGEPLLNKKESLNLLSKLWLDDYFISVETNGTVDITPFFRYVDSFVIDYKVGIKRYDYFYTNYFNLRKSDVIKFVVNENTLHEAVEYYRFLKSIYNSKIEKKEVPIFAFSPILSEDYTAKQLYEALKFYDVHNVLISLQLHKIAGFQ